MKIKNKSVKKLKIQEPIVFGIGMGLVFWQVFDSILMGIFFGIIFYTAFNETKKRSKK